MTQKMWLEPDNPAPDADLIAACDGDPLVAAILARRGFRDPAKVRGFLSAAEYSPAPPEQFPDLVTASALIRDMLGKKILVWGDFDVDGQTASALLVDGLKGLGANVVYYVPNRLTESHGIKISSLEVQLNEHQPDLLITCDTGVTEFEAMEWIQAQFQGRLKVIITDHHDLSDHLPPADAVINPRRLPHGHALTSLPGVGVAYKLMQHLYTTLDRAAELPRLLDLVALGIVGDVATQTDDTRYLLQIGLEQLRHTARMGLIALMEVANLAPLTVTGTQVGYQLGPRLNAAGRLGDARLSVELLTTHDRARARFIAQQLESYNVERRLQTRHIESQAAEIIAANPMLLEAEALVMYHPRWHPGILGIVANRLAERYEKPVILLTDGDEAGRARGSGRAVTGYDISAAITAQADLLYTFGGHPGAAGLSLDVANIDQFRERVSAQLAATKNTDHVPALKIDAIVSLDQLTLGVASSIQRLAPFGEGNPPVVLESKGLRLSHAAFIGRDQQHRKLIVEDSAGHQQTLLWWGGGTHALPRDTFDIVYHAEIDNRRELQLSMVDFRQYADAPTATPEIPFEVYDFRAEANPASALQKALQECPDALIWAEAYPRQETPTWKRRADLIAAEVLIIYTAPPDPQSLRKVLDKVNPKVIYIIGAESPLTSLNDTLKRLGFAGKNAIDALGGQVDADLLCGAVAGSVRLVRAGLDYLLADGQFTEVIWPDNQTVRLRDGRAGRDGRDGNHRPSEQKSNARTRLETAYREVEAYRRYFRVAPIDRLIED